MQTESVFIARPENTEQINALKAFMKAMKIKFEVTTTAKPYNQEFVDMLLGAEKEIKAGKGLKVTAEKFDQLWK